MGLEQTGKARPGVLQLKGTVQHYDWGGHEFIPGLLGIRNEEQKPFAELWIGAHPKSPSVVELSGAAAELPRIIAQSPVEFLGAAAASRFGGRLPYLLKVLDAKRMLSIQAHPDKLQAEEGFAREDAAGISLHSDQRNYRDENHKPEVHVALTEFWMLHGFRPLEQIAGIFSSPELAPVMPDLNPRVAAVGGSAERQRDLLRELYSLLMRMPQPRVDEILTPLIKRLEGRNTDSKDDPDFWALRAARAFSFATGHYDRGIFSIYLLNLLHLRPGQGTFQPAGVLHCYLEGTNVELMANSDNVLRGGLTAKNVDVDELLRIVSFEGGFPSVLAGQPVSATETVYRTQTDEFELSRIEVSPGKAYECRAGHGPDCMIVLAGTAEMEWSSELMQLKRGNIVFVPDNAAFRIRSQTGPAVLYKASVPV